MNEENTLEHHRDTSTRYKKDLGAFGEECARTFLRGKGYSILATNFCVRGGEIDVIARINDELVIIEVKTRTSMRYGYGEEAVTPTKMRHMKYASSKYPRPSGIRYIRFDIIAVDIDLRRKKMTIRHIKNIACT